ncbi:hypothetical protein [Streptomyces sp. NPDC059597]|uniref:hypothetical protein n=1 Tax=Streptomyces sp. NPDC059597 TaxID=3346879 RepID=UPI00367AAAC1
MDLRPELSPPPVSAQRLEELSRDIERIAELVRGGAGEAGDEISAFNLKTGHAYEAPDFTEYDGSRSLSAFASEAARPARPRVADVTADELTELVSRVLTGSPESDYCLRLLRANVPHPRISDLIFHPPAGLRDASPERIVAEALAYRPMAL